ncbi:hypothetical protein IMZ48_38275 [Candidatus Bathyarchaeota archaeon]|nr:hypothetical protein [Candidatus Bathyarchaeota archaeon]
MTPYTVLIPDPPTRYAALMSMMLLKAFAVILGFPCITILLTNSCSSLRILGTLNGFATTSSALGRAFGPALAGTLFSWGASKGTIVPAWWFLALMAIIGAIPTWQLVDGDGPSHSTESSDAEYEDGDNTTFVDSADENEEDAEDAPLLGGRREGYGGAN